MNEQIKCGEIKVGDFITLRRGINSRFGCVLDTYYSKTRRVHQILIQEETDDGGRWVTVYARDVVVLEDRVD